VDAAERGLLRLGHPARRAGRQGAAASCGHRAVAFVPGTAFFADGTGQSHLRLSYCYPEPDRIREGVRRLATVLEEEVELRSTFGPTGPRRHEAAQAQSPAPTWPEEPS
jgi:hypothetical protein